MGQEDAGHGWNISPIIKKEEEEDNKKRKISRRARKRSFKTCGQITMRIFHLSLPPPPAGTIRGKSGGERNEVFSKRGCVHACDRKDKWQQSNWIKVQQQHWIRDQRDTKMDWHTAHYTEG